MQLQGMGEIRAAADRLEALPQFRAGNMWVLPLHSTVSPADQRKVKSGRNARNCVPQTTGEPVDYGDPVDHGELNLGLVPGSCMIPQTCSRLISELFTQEQASISMFARHMAPR